MSYEIRERETTYRARAFDVQKVKIQLPNQRTASYDLVDHNDSISVVPVDAEGNILFVHQYRVGAEKELLELPAGVLEDDEDPQAGAARETREEIGMSAGKMLLLGGYYLAPGYCNEHMSAFLATELKEDPLPADDDEFLRVEAIPIAKAYQLAFGGEISDSKSLAALLLAYPYLVSG